MNGHCLVTQTMCLPSHGSSMAPSVEARLRELYPDDQASGFQEGDLRGIVWATLPAGH